ncbi:hypothetical protein B296_00032545 [Ensete ventricosum]|uniref:Uncharacterized protein n=1 Tax=Ensete ventricosum TaxID=4639 RepID=A0A426Z8K9_ENSVE|nr:hypothetical protein B296_00032545 [Ensete ventricosum]
MGEWRLLRKRGIGLGAAATTRGAAIKGEMEVEGSTERAKQPSSLRDGTAIVEPAISVFSSAREKPPRVQERPNGCSRGLITALLKGTRVPPGTSPDFCYDYRQSSHKKRTHRCETTKNRDPQRLHVRRESVWDMSWGHDVYSTSIAETRSASTVQLTPKTMS